MLLLAALAARRSVAFLPPVTERAAVDGAMGELAVDAFVSDRRSLDPDVLLGGECDAVARVGDPLDLVVPVRPTPDGPFLHLRTSGTTTGRPGWARVHHADAILAARAMCRLPHYRSGKHRLVFLNPPLSPLLRMSTFLEYLHAGSAFVLPSPGRAFFDFLKIGRDVTTIEGVPDLYAGLARLRSNPAPSLVHVGVGRLPPPRRHPSSVPGSRRHHGIDPLRGSTQTPSAVAHHVFALDDERLPTGPRVARRRRSTASGSWTRPARHAHRWPRGSSLSCGRHLADGVGSAARRDVRTLHTEDFGFLDPDGSLHVTGRTKHFIKHHGFRISARTVEEGFLATDAVQDCRAYHDGSQLVLEVVLGHPVEPAASLRKPRLAFPLYAVPDRIEVVAAIAKTLTGKTVRA